MLIQNTIIFITVLISLFQSIIYSDISEYEIHLTLENSYQFDRGYYISFLEYENGFVYAIVPQLRRIYTIDVGNSKIDYFTYERGRGPNEISRGPFGISISDNGIILNDTDLQRGVFFNHSGEPKKTILYEPFGILSGTAYNAQQQDCFLNKVLNPLRGIRYTLANPYDNQLSPLLFKLPNIIQEELYRSRNTFRVDGYGTLTNDYLVHANIYHGDMLIWDKSNGNYVKTVKVFDAGNPSPLQAQLGELSGMIPPQNSDAKFISITDNPVDSHRVFLIIESKDGSMKTNWVYDYNFIDEKIVGEYLIDEHAKLIQSSESKLFVYSEVNDMIYQYAIHKTAKE